MPGRYTIALILAFFIGMVGWHFVRSSSSYAGEGPPLKASLELAAEDGTTDWKINYNQKRLGIAQTTVRKTPNGLYLLKQNVDLDGDLESFLGPFSSIAKLSGIKLNEFLITIRTEMDLTYLGSMQRLAMTFEAKPRPIIVLPGSSEEKKMQAEQLRKANNVEGSGKNNVLKMSINGKVLMSEELSFKGELVFAGIRFPIDDVKVKYRSKESFFSNIAPTDCLANIRLGQRWMTPVIDPTQMMVGALASSKAKELSNGAFNADDLVKTKVAEVRVLDELRELEWNGMKIPCYVVQSSEKGSKMQIWVNYTNNRVLKQSAESDRYLLEMVRLPTKVE